MRWLQQLFSMRRRRPASTANHLRRERKLFLEPLEDRRLLATVSVALSTHGSEWGTPVAFIVSRDSSDPTNLTVNFTLTGSATNGTDYPNTPLSVTIPATFADEWVTFIPTDDNLDEGTESVILTITSGSYTIGSPASATAYIGDSDMHVEPVAISSTLCVSPACSCTCEPATASADAATGTTTASWWAGFPAGSLSYDSSTAAPIALMQANVNFGPSIEESNEDIDAEFFWNNDSMPTVEKAYDSDNLDTFEDYRAAAAVSAAGLGTGYYPWMIDLKTYNPHSVMWDSHPVYSGTRVVDRTDSEFGPGWAANLVDKLAIQSNGALWAPGGGGAWWFSKDGSGDYHREAGEPGYSGLVYSGGVYTITTKYGEVLNFNSSGLLTSRADRSGNTTTYAYTDADSDFATDEISTITDWAGRVTTFGYTGGLVTSITDPYSGVVTLGYTSGKLTSITEPDPDGGGPLSAPVTSFTYTGNLLATLTDAESNTTEFTYAAVTDGPSFVTSVEYPGSAEEDLTTIFALALASNTTLIKVADLIEVSATATGKETETQRDRFGRPTEITDPNGNTTTIARDGEGRPTTVTTPDPDGVGGESAYVTEYEYDANGNLDLLTHADSTTEEWVYDLDFNVPTSYTDRLGNETTWTLDQTFGYVLTETREGGVVTTFTYTSAPSDPSDPPAGLVATITDPLGVVTELEYDEFGNLVLMTQAAGTDVEATTEYEYTDDLLTAAIDELGRRTEYVYDSLRRLLETTLEDPDGAGPLASPVIAYEYDQKNRIVLMVDALGRETEYVYDARGNQTHVIRPDHDGDTELTETEYVFNLANQLTSVIDPIGRITAFDYDDAGQMIETTLPDPDGAGGASSPVTSTTYDTLGRVKTTTDPLGNVTTYAYSDHGQTVTITLPDPDGVGGASSPVLVREYDAAGNLISETDALNNETTYDYDDLNRLVLVTAPDPDGAGGASAPETAYQYDTLGNLTQIIDPLGNRTIYAYDARGRRIVERRATGELPTIATATTTQATQTSEVQSVGYAITGGGTLTGGTFTLTYDGQTTAAINYNAAASAVQSALEALSNLAPGDVSVLKTTDTSTSKIWQITFTGSLAGTNVVQTTIDTGNITHFGGSKTETETTTTAGSATSEVQTVTLGGSPTGGTFKLVFGGETTAALDYDATAGEVETALEALTAIDAVSVSGSAGGPFTITFEGTHTGQNVQTLWPIAFALTNANDLEVTTLFTFDDAGQMLSVTDPLGRVTSYQYDNLGRLILTTLPDPDGAGGQAAAEIANEYDAASRLISTTDPLGNVTEYEYDLLDNLVLVTQADPDGGGGLASPETAYEFDAAGQLLEMTDAMGRVTTHEYDGLGRRTKTTQPDPDGVGGVSAPFTTFSYDAAGNLLTVTDPLSHVTEYEYDNLYRRILITDAEEGETSFTYDANGRMLSLTDPVSNTTEWVYDNLGRKIEETNELSDTRYFEYDAVGNLVERVDRLGRIIVWEYDDLYRNTAEKWYDGVNLVHTLNWEYDAAGQLSDAYDVNSNYGYIYDDLGRLTEESQSFGDFSPLLEYERTFSAAGSVLTIQAIIGGTADFENALTYDNLQRVTRLEQAEYGSGNTVAEKRFDFAYDAASAFTRIDRYADLAGSEYVASTHYAYDGIGRLLRLTHNDSTTPAAGFGNSPLAGYQYAYDAASRILSIDSYLDDLTEYTHDDTNQLTAADHYTATDESYTYDANGNRDDANYDVDPNNQMATDGIYTFTYDAEGNRSSRVKISNDYVTVYEWDHRNRLTAVIEQDDEENVLTSTHYTYDVNNRWIRRTIDPDGDAGSDPLEETFFSHLDGQIALQFDGTTAGDLSHRYAWNPAAVDQLLADENALNEILWSLNDHLGTTRDLAEYEDGPDTPSIVNHRFFDSFGNLVNQTNGSITILIGFTGRPFDDSTGLQNNTTRWYMPDLGTWMSEDWIGFLGQDTNIGRYVRNAPTAMTDADGLVGTATSHGGWAPAGSNGWGGTSRPAAGSWGGNYPPAGWKPYYYRSYSERMSSGRIAWPSPDFVFETTLTAVQQTALKRRYGKIHSITIDVYATNHFCNRGSGSVKSALAEAGTFYDSIGIHITWNVKFISSNTHTKPYLQDLNVGDRPNFQLYDYLKSQGYTKEREIEWFKMNYPHVPTVFLIGGVIDGDGNKQAGYTPAGTLFSFVSFLYPWESSQMSSGEVIAHEVGHLFGYETHDPTGVMGQGALMSLDKNSQNAATIGTIRSGCELLSSPKSK